MRGTKIEVRIQEPEIGLAVATSAVWQKPAEKPAGKIPEAGTTVKTAFPAKTANAKISISYELEKNHENAGTIDPASDLVWICLQTKRLQPTRLCI